MFALFEMIGYAFSVTGIPVTGFGSPTSKRTAALFLELAVFLCPLFGESFWSLNREPLGSPLLLGVFQPVQRPFFVWKRKMVNFSFSKEICYE